MFAQKPGKGITLKMYIRGWGFSSAVERLPSERKALGSVPSSEKKKKKKEMYIRNTQVNKKKGKKHKIKRMNCLKKNNNL